MTRYLPGGGRGDTLKELFRQRKDHMQRLGSEIGHGMPGNGEEFCVVATKSLRE